MQDAHIHGGKSRDHFPSYCSCGIRETAAELPFQPRLTVLSFGGQSAHGMVHVNCKSPMVQVPILHALIATGYTFPGKENGVCGSRTALLATISLPQPNRYSSGLGTGLCPIRYKEAPSARPRYLAPWVLPGRIQTCDHSRLLFR